MRSSEQHLSEVLALAPASGMHDLLDPHSVARRRMADGLVAAFARYGYHHVVAPLFERDDVIERGLAGPGRMDMVRFVEPDTGEVAVLRPDITPQMARIIATRLRDRPPPFRLCYEGAVIRRGASGPEQIDQAGIECVGLPENIADAEVIEVALRACSAVGVTDVRVELGQVQIAERLLDEVQKEARSFVLHALARKDVVELERALRLAGANRTVQNHLRALAELYGDVSVIKQARKRYGNYPRVVDALNELDALVETLAARGIADGVLVDLGELWGQAYYTGTCFTLLAHGPGRPVGTGGRYDHVLARFGMPAPACGAALDLGRLEQARAEKTSLLGLPLRLVLAGDHASDVARHLRIRGFDVAEVPHDSSTALAFAERWSYDAVVIANRTSLRATRIAPRTEERFVGEDIDGLCAWLNARQGK